MELRVTGAIHLADAAGAEQPTNLIPPDLASGQHGRRGGGVQHRCGHSRGGPFDPRVRRAFIAQERLALSTQALVSRARRNAADPPCRVPARRGRSARPAASDQPWRRLPAGRCVPNSQRAIGPRGVRVGSGPLRATRRAADVNVKCFAGATGSSSRREGAEQAFTVSRTQGRCSPSVPSHPFPSAYLSASCHRPTRRSWT